MALSGREKVLATAMLTHEIVIASLSKTLPASMRELLAIAQLDIDRSIYATFSMDPSAIADMNDIRARLDKS